MNRREIVVGAGAGFTAACMPLLYFSPHVPHVYLARSVRLAPGWELETWRHSDDRSWSRQLSAWDELDYESRHDMMHELYLWERPRDRAS
jgi:hypothetical protein